MSHSHGHEHHRPDQIESRGREAKAKVYRTLDFGPRRGDLRFIVIGADPGESSLYLDA